MIRFKKQEDVVAFLEKKLPEKIKKDLFFEKHRWERNGKMREYTGKLKPVDIVWNLIQMRFVIGIIDNPDYYPFPNEFILMWTKMQKFIADNDSLSLDQEQMALVSINKACKMLEVTRPTLYKILNDRKIPFVEVLSQKRIQIKDLIEYINKNKRFI